MSKSKQGAESERTEPASGSAAKKAAKPKSVAPVSVSGSSRASSKGPGSGHAEPKWKSSREMMEYLTALHGELLRCPKTRDLKERIILLHKGFKAREWVRKLAWEHGREVGRKQTGYSRKKMHLHDQWLVEDQSGLSEFEKLAEQAVGDDRYDSEADDELDRLEASLEREKSSQVKWKKER